MEDEAVLVLGAQRLLEGEWPYRDWATRHTPGTYFLGAAYFSLVGSAQLGTRSLMSLVAALSGSLLLLIARQLGLRGALLYLPWLMWSASGLLDFPILNYHWVAGLFTLTTLGLTLLWAQQGSSRTMAIALGASAAACFWCLQSEGLAAALMVGLVWLRRRPSGLSRVAFSCVLTSLVLWLPLVPYAWEVWRQNFHDLWLHLPYNRHAYSWQPVWEQARDWWYFPWRQSPLLWGFLFTHWWINLIRFGLFYVLLGLALIRFWRRPWPAHELTLCTLAWALSVGNRQTVAYVAFACPGTYLLLALLLAEWKNGRRLAWPLIALEVFGFGCRAYYFLTVARLPIVTRAGVYYTSDPQLAQRNAQLRNWVDRFLPPNTKVLAYPYLCSLYTLEQLKNPLAEPVLTPFLYSEEDFARSVERLRNQQVEWIVHQELSPAEMLRSYSIPVETYRLEAAKRLGQMTVGYELCQGNEHVGLYRRTKPSSTGTVVPPAQ